MRANRPSKAIDIARFKITNGLISAQVSPKYKRTCKTCRNIIDAGKVSYKVYQETDHHKVFSSFLCGGCVKPFQSDILTQAAYAIKSV